MKFVRCDQHGGSNMDYPSIQLGQIKFCNLEETKPSSSQTQFTEPGKFCSDPNLDGIAVSLTMSPYPLFVDRETAMLSTPTTPTNYQPT